MSAVRHQWSTFLTVFSCRAVSSASHVVQILEKILYIFSSGPVHSFISTLTGFKTLAINSQSCQPADLCSSPVKDREMPSNIASKLLKGAMHCGCASQCKTCQNPGFSGFGRSYGIKNTGCTWDCMFT